MSVGTWNPDEDQQAKQPEIDQAFLQRAIELSESEQLDNLQDAFNEQDRGAFAGYMRLGADVWGNVAKTLNSEQVFHAIRFFTVAEMQLAGWEANEKSPVIGLNKALKQRGEPLNRDQVMWIKNNTQNRFLPNGPLL